MKTYKILFVSILLLFISAGNAFSKSYFVKEDGNDQLDGLSDATAWKTIKKVNSFSFLTGDDVYFKCDDSWTGERLAIDWSGISENRVIIGAYYGSGVTGVSGNKPIINGLGMSSFANQWVGLVQIDTQNYVTIQNLNVINSYGIGVRFNNGALYGEVKNIDVSTTGDASIQFNGNSTRYGLVESCTATLAGLGSRGANDHRPEGFDNWWPYANDKLWPFAIGATYADNVTIRSCKVYNVFAEGIGFYKGSDNCIAEHNLVYNAWAVGIYIDAGKNNILRYNMVYGTTDKTYWRGSTSVGWGLAIEDESLVAARSENNLVHGNFVAFCYSGVYIGISAAEGAIFKASNILNNTFVGNDIGINISGNSFSSSSIKNNIIWLSDGTKLYSGPSTTPGLTWDSNNWSQSVISGVTSDNDVIDTPPLKKTTGWRSLTAEELKISDFSLERPYKTKAANLGDQFIKLVDATSSEFPSHIVMANQNHDGAGWFFGADVFIANAELLETQKPTAPKNLSISQ